MLGALGKMYHLFLQGHSLTNKGWFPRLLRLLWTESTSWHPVCASPCLIWQWKSQAKAGLLWLKLSHHSLSMWPLKEETSLQSFLSVLGGIMPQFRKDTDTLSLLKSNSRKQAHWMSDVRKWVHVSSYHNKAICCWLGFSSQLLLCSVKGSSVHVFSRIHAHHGAFIIETL